MNTIIYLAIGLVGGALIGWGIKNRKAINGDDCCAPQNQNNDIQKDQRGIVKDEVGKKEENLQKIREFMATKDRITNNDVEQLVWVSDATAERYLNQLEKEGIIKQVGTGSETYYTKI